MIGFNRMRSMMMFCLVLVTLTALLLASAAQTTQVNGTVKLKQADGTEVPARRFESGERVTTAKGSSAVVSLGKLGRVEVFEETEMTLSFDNINMTAMLDSGRVRLSTSSGVNATVKTSDGEIVATGDKLKEFTVDLTCGDTFVSVKKGTVELRAGGTVKQIAAGGQDTAGTARPDCRR